MNSENLHRGALKSLASALLVGVLGFAVSAEASRHVFVGFHRDGAANVDGLSNASGVTVSPDGQHVYVAGTGENEIAICARDAVSGALSFVGIAAAAAMNAPGSVVVSGDGSYAYVGANGDLVVFSRDSGSGLLTFVETQLFGTAALVLSPDNDHLYATSAGSDALGVFSRSAVTGELTLIETHTDGVGGVDGLADARSIAISSDGDHVYVGGQDDDAIAIFDRNTTTGELTFVGTVEDGVSGVTGLNAVSGLAVSPDGDHLYAVGDQVVVFSRDDGTGALTHVETVNGIQLTTVSAVEVAPDGTHVHVIAGGSTNGLATFVRDASTGELTLEQEFVDDTDGVDGVGGAEGVAVSADSSHVYVAALEGTVAAFRKVNITCSPTALGGCFQPNEPNKAKVTILDHAIGTRDKLVWKWVKGAALTVGDFGDPVATANDYALCVYSSVGGAVLETEMLAPALGGCKKPTDGGALSCWTPLSTVGFRYSRKSRHPDGVTPVKLLAGAAGSSKVLAKAKGEQAPLPGLPLTLPVTVQLQNADGTCWEAVYGTATVNDGVMFKALAD